MLNRIVVVMLLVAAPAFGAVIAEKNFDGGALGGWDFTSLAAHNFVAYGSDWTLTPDAGAGLCASKPPGASGNGIYVQGTGMIGNIGRMEMDIN